EQEARIAQARAAERRRSVVREFRGQLSAPDVGRVLGISKQRVYQIEKTADEGKKVAGQKVAGQKVAS
ncbi:hypothetical protein NSP29_24440, partial [Salmonella enterica]|nr:hypothetical protein [Salmonella enterica]